MNEERGRNGFSRMTAIVSTVAVFVVIIGYQARSSNQRIEALERGVEKLDVQERKDMIQLGAVKERFTKVETEAKRFEKQIDKLEEWRAEHEAVIEARDAYQWAAIRSLERIEYGKPGELGEPIKEK